MRTWFLIGALLALAATPALARHKDTHHHHMAAHRAADHPSHKSANEAMPAQSSSSIPAPAEAPGEDQKFYAFLHDFRGQALDAGIKPKTYDRAVDGISLNARVQQLNQQQPEFVRPVWDYLDSALSDSRVAKGEDKLDEFSRTLDRIETKYGIPREILVAIWGCETAYGESEGSFNLFEALATLAYEGPRADYGRTQLIAGLKIADEEGFDPHDMTGSWAGAMGHTQFVPTTYLDHAVDGDGDSKRDVWNSEADALASAANYLNALGWKEGERWGEEVQLPKDFAYEESDPDLKKSRNDWAKEGVTRIPSEPLKGDEKGAIFLPAGWRGPAFLTYDNFEVLQQYNASSTYALAVALLADRYRGRIVQASWPRDEQPLAREQMTELQGELSKLGYDAGNADGLLGKRTRSAIRAYQKMKKLPADGFPTLNLFYQILEDIHAAGK